MATLTKGDLVELLDMFLIVEFRRLRDRLDGVTDDDEATKDRAAATYAAEHLPSQIRECLALTDDDIVQALLTRLYAIN